MNTDRETEFTHYDVEYVAVTSDPNSCQGCVFHTMHCSALGLPSCFGATRKDKVSKIFVKK